MFSAIYLGPKPTKTVWHNHGSDADGSPYRFEKGVPLPVPDSLAQVLNTAPNFRLSDGTIFITDPLIKDMHDNDCPVKFLLIRYLGGIGDILMVTPAIRGVREKFPNAQITFAINKAYFNGTLYEVIEHNPHIDILLDAKQLTIAQKQSYTAWIDLSHPCARYEAHTAPHVDKHRSEIYCDECGVIPSSYKPEIYLTPEDEAVAMEFFADHDLYDEKVIALQPFAADLRRTWGEERMIALVRSMPSYTFLWVDHDKRLTSDIPNNLIDIGVLKIRQLAAIVKRCVAAVSCDSFLLQVAGAVDTPTVAIFGATNPYMRCKFHSKWTTIWNKSECTKCPCWYMYPCLNTSLQNLGNLVILDRDKNELGKRRCLESVTVEQVKYDIEEFLK